MAHAQRISRTLKRAAVFALAAMTVCIVSGEAHAAKLSFKLSNQFPPSHHVSVGLRVFADKVAELSGGEITAEVFDSGALYRDAEIVKAIRSGSTEVGLVPVNKWSGIMPAVDIFEVPFAFKDLESIKAYLDNGAADLFDGAFSRYGVKNLFWVDYGYVQFFNSKRPLKTPEDFRGLTMRAFSAGDAEILKALGAAPTIISSAELYMALQRGTIDGTTTGMPAAVTRKVVEVQKYMTLANYSVAEFVVQANLKWWKGLSDEQRATIAKAAEQAEAYIRSEVARAESEAEAEVKAAGLEVHVLSADERAVMIKATDAIRDSYLKKSGELGGKLLPLVDSLQK